MQNKLYFVRWLLDGRVATEDRFANLEDAKRHAMDEIKLYRTLGLATSALICDDDGKEHMRVF